MRWGISGRVASVLPFSNAYFPVKQQFLAALIGPVSCRHFIDLVNLISSTVSSSEYKSYSIFSRASQKTRIDHKSTWSMLMAFPHWFFFAAVLLFSKKNSENVFLLSSSSDKTESEDTINVPQYNDAAARYLAYALSPTNATQCDLLVECLMEISRSWTVKQCGQDKKYEQASSRRKLTKPKLPNKGKTATDIYDSQVVSIWLKEFHDHHMRYLRKINKHSGKKISKDSSQKHTLLFQRIPLGIFIGCPSIDEGGCEVLLHYATTGVVISPIKIQNTKSKLATMHEASNGLEEAVIGVRLVFNLFNIIEDMSESLFDTEESELHFVLKLKNKSFRFLVNYIWKLLNLTTDEVDREKQTLMDVRQRVERWRHQGEEVFEGYKALEDLCSALDIKISSL